MAASPVSAGDTDHLPGSFRKGSRLKKMPYHNKATPFVTPCGKGTTKSSFSIIIISWYNFWLAKPIRISQMRCETHEGASLSVQSLKQKTWFNRES